MQGGKDIGDRRAWSLGPPSGARIAVLGGAGGIGRALVSACVGLGHRVAVLDLPAALAAHPPAADVEAVAIEAGDPSAITQGFARLAASWGALDGYVGLGGFMTRRTPVAEMTPDVWRELIAGNLDSAFLGARAAVGLLSRGRDPALVLVSSGLAQRVMPGYGGYAAAKAATIALVKALAVENAPTIRANCVAPGAVETAFLTGGTGRPAAAEQIDRAAYLRGVPLGRIAVPDDVVGPILFLLGPASCYMTGQTLYVNGGGLTP
jgi:3-oxoacyl-[acyl-carrier protein] reductase